MADQPALQLEDLMKVESFPTAPEVALEVLRLSRDPEAGLADVVRTVEVDPALTSKILETANSAAYARDSAATSLSQAGSRLGTRSLTIIVLGFSLANEFPSRGQFGGIELRDYWDRSLTAAVAGRLIAQAINSKHAEEAFLCGLLSNVGRLGLALGADERYAELDKTDDIWPSLDAEAEQLGLTSVDVGSALLGKWAVPETIIDAVRLANGTTPPEEELAAIAFCARSMAKLRFAPNPTVALGELCDHMNAVGCSEADTDFILEKLDLQLEETASIMRIDLPEAVSNRDLVNEVRMELVSLTLDASMQLVDAEARNSDLEDQNARLEESALTDHLTGLPNRASFDDYVKSYLASAARGQTDGCLGLAVIDIDHFKQVNDVHGHAAGDEVLRMIGGVLSSTLRGYEKVCRIGGEEFVLVSSGITTEGLAVVCERLRSLAEQMESQPKVTISVGFALGRCLDQQSVDDLLALADSRLYEAKTSGRNRVVGEPT